MPEKHIAAYVSNGYIDDRRKDMGGEFMGALEGIKILDLTRKLTCSLATMYLAAYGAEVVKVETPEGDPARKWEPIVNGESVYFNYLNSNKKSIVIDYETSEGQELIRKLAKNYDVFCIDLEPKKREAYGLAYEDIKVIRDDIIYASYSYFGDNGPYKDRPGSSLTVHAKGVAMDMTGIPGEEPIHLAPSVAEHYAAAYYATGIVMAALDRIKKGTGQKVDISLLDSIFSVIEAAPAACSTIGEIQRRKGNDDPTCAPYDTFETNDGYVTIGVATQTQWINFCEAMGFDDFLKDPVLMDPAQRLATYRENLQIRLGEKLKKMSKFEVEAKARTKGVPCGAVLKINEISEMPNTIENNYIGKVHSELLGDIDYPMIPFVLSKSKAKPFTDAPAMGSHNGEILEGGE